VITLHLAATCYMSGLIWVIQMVHYPMLARTGESFDDCQRFHLSRMTFIVAPVMLLELACAIWLAWRYPDEPVWWAGLALLAVIWISTFILQVPRHDKLARDGFSQTMHAGLVNSNWIRTAAWTLRAILFVYISAK